jgi:hypothetical protein
MANEAAAVPPLLRANMANFGYGHTCQHSPQPHVAMMSRHPLIGMCGRGLWVCGYALLVNHDNVVNVRTQQAGPVDVPGSRRLCYSTWARSP